MWGGGGPKPPATLNPLGIPFIFPFLEAQNLDCILQAKGKKKSKKAQIMTVRDGDFENDYGDEVGGGEYDDFI